MDLVKPYSLPNIIRIGSNLETLIDKATLLWNLGECTEIEIITATNFCPKFENIVYMTLCSFLSFNLNIN